MASSYETFKDLELTRDEVERITDALKNKEFRKLLTDYVEDVRNPENQKIYQQEITQLEKERGIDITFLNPEAGYVIKTSANGTKKAFINICSNENVQKPTSMPAVQDGTKGLHWSLPHSLTPPREDIDNKGDRCIVYDVIYHTDTLHLASKNKTFRKMVNDMACKAIESNFDVVLDKKNLKFPKLQYKGYPQAAVIRKPSQIAPPELAPEEKEVMDKLFAQVDASAKTDYPKKKGASSSKKRDADDKSVYTIPTYVIKQRRSYGMEECIEHKNAKLETTIPKELVVEICLPLLKSSSDIVLDVAEKTLQLISEKPAKYKLSLTLPYNVNQDNGNAKFDKDKKKLVVTLPVKKITATGVRTLVLSSSEKDGADSGVDTDYSSPIASSPLEEIEHEMDCSSNSNNSLLSTEIESVADQLDRFVFLDSNYHYSLPEFKAHLNELEHIIVLTIAVKNVRETSIKKLVTTDDFYLKFNSVSSGFFPIYCALYFRLPPSSSFIIDTTSTLIDIWDNNLTVQIRYNQNQCVASDNTEKLASFLYGLDQNDLTEKCFETDNNTIIINDDDDIPEVPETQPTQYVLTTPKKLSSKNQRKRQKKSKAAEAAVIEVPETRRSRPIDISGTSESSGDEFSHSLSPGKGRGILKYMRAARRTVSESGLDEVKWASSLENNNFTSVDSVIPEEGEISSSFKKTVRFNDVVSRKLYRSNSSILGQRKKNQRKSKAKKRAQERRHSESEVSETDERKERDLETTNTTTTSENVSEDGASPESNFNSEIFELDIN